MNSNKAVVASFVDRYGEERHIHNTRHGLTVKRRTDTLTQRLNRPLAALIGQRIRHEREARGWTLEYLCLAAGLVSATPKSRMWEIENAIRKNGIHLGTLYAIAAALGIEASDLLPSTAEILHGAGVKALHEKRLGVVP